MRNEPQTASQIGWVHDLIKIILISYLVHARGDAAWLVQREPWLCVATTPQDLGPLTRLALILVSHRFETCAGASNVTGIFEPGRNLNGTDRHGNDVALVTLDDDFSYPPRVMATLIDYLK